MTYRNINQFSALPRKWAWLYSSVLAGGALLINGATSLPALADPCTAPVDTATQTTCQNNSSATTLTYPASNPLYVNPPGGPFTLLLDNYDVTAAAGNGITFGPVVGGDGTITLQNDSDVISGAGGNGIDATAGDGNKFINVKDTSSVTGDLHGINASTTTGNVTIKTEVGSEVVGTTGNGINAKATTGDVFVETRGKVTSTGGGINGFGISAEVGTGAVTVDAYGDVSATYTGISATSSNGKVKVTTAAGTTVTGGTGAGIDAEALTTGNVEVNAQGAVKGSSYGILAAATFGTTMVTTGTGAVEATGGPGIYAAALDVGSVTVKTGGAVTGTGGIGIHAEAVRGFVEVITNGAPGTLISGTNGAGILAESTTSGLVYVEVHTTVTGSTIGIDANATSGTVEVTTDTAAILGQAGHGIDATSAGTALPVGMAAVNVVTGGKVTGQGGAGINAVATGDGDVKVTTNNDPLALTPTLVEGQNGAGIFASADGTGNTDVEVHTAVTGSTTGIRANATAGKVEVTTDTAAILGQAGPGIDATASGDVTVGTGGAVTGTGSVGINAQSGNFGNVKVTTSGPVVGTQVLGTSGAGINADTGGAGTVTIINGTRTLGSVAGVKATSGTGLISITNDNLIANSSLSDNDLAIQTTGGPTTIENNSAIIGRVVTGASADQMINDLLWITEDTSDFGAGNDTVNNNAIIQAGDAAGFAETTTFANLENLNNNTGVIDLQDETFHGGSNISDRLVTSGNYIGNGGGLSIDAFLGGAGSLADVLDVGGNVTGATQVFVTDTNAGPGVYNPTGILVAHAAGTTAAGDFVLANGPIDKGLFAYDLVFDAAKGDHMLVGLPDREAFEPLAAVAGAQAIWRESADAWSTRQENLRDMLATGHIVTAVADPPVQGSDAPSGGLWASALGSWSTRDDDASFSLLDANLDFDMSYKQDIYGVVGGADFRTGLGASGGSLLFGVMAGYVDSALDFDEGSTSIDSKGATLGAYAGLLSNGFFATVLVQADLLKMDYQVGSLAADDSDDADVTSIGARGDLGYRFGDTLFVEPMISVDGFSTKIDDFSVGGADIDAGTNESYRAGAGLRAGYGGEMVRASATARVWDVFSTDNEVDVLAGVPLGLSDDDLEGVYGDVSGQVDITLSASVTAYLKGGILFSDDVTKPNASGGFAFTW